ncbi:hypothetical protein [Curtobacterium sp. Leaf261]|nr:hypothetical protein [Curtobacterium sp. Leaf261]
MTRRAMTWRAMTWRAMTRYVAPPVAPTPLVATARGMLGSGGVE